MNALELMSRLMVGKRVEGVLYVDEETGRLTFKAWNRKERTRSKDRLVKKLPWGWVKESIERVKVFGSFPKNMGMEFVVREIDHHAVDAKVAVTDGELDLIEFC